MKKITLLLVLNLSFIIYNSQQAKAQYVTIPDANFVNWLTQNYPSCINGSQMDTTCSSIVNETSLTVNSLGIVNLSGVQYFDNLFGLDCAYNQLTSLPALPNSLTHLYCYNNQLTSLPTLPNSITHLYCYNNPLTSLPTLPSSLTELSCMSNQLTSLPTLPNSLAWLKCTFNQLTSLPSLPNLLIGLNCENNQISCFPNLPLSITNPFFFNISNNPFTCLPNYIAAMDATTLAYPLCVYGDTVNNIGGCASAVLNTSCNAQYTLLADSALQSVWYLVNQCMGSDSLSADSLQYTWSWGDSLNSTSTGAYPSFNYSSPGNYVICVTITDTISGCTSTYCDSSTYISKSLSNQMIQVNVVPSYSPVITKSNNLAIQTIGALKCYPNPAKDILFIECNSGLNPQSQINLYDVLGNEMSVLFTFSRQYKSPLRGDIEGLPAGVYFVKVGNDVKKFIKN